MRLVYIYPAKIVAALDWRIRAAPYDKMYKATRPLLWLLPESNWRV